MSEQVKVTFHGGLGDIGRNCATVETDDAMLVLDCGVLFPSEERPGVDFVLPDLSYIFERAEKVVGCITTHGHEDHIGALSHLLSEVPTAIHGSPFTLGLARRRVKEAKLDHRAEWLTLADGERRTIGPFSCEFIPVTHSVPGGLISAIGTPQGIILHSSDFKLDRNPIDGRHTDLARISTLARDPGIRLLLADSTNADVPGSTASESEIGPAIADVLAANQGRRVIVACFASHLHRVQQVVDAAIRDNRMVATLGMSMQRNVRLGRDLGIVRIPEESLISIEESDYLAPGELCVLSTGSQAEPRSSLATAAAGDNRWIKLGEEDTIVLSAHPIPGNEAAVATMINRMMERGAEVVHAGALHTSGHGKRDELAELHAAASPEWFVPVHGELRHMLAHADLAEERGMNPERVILARDGDQVVLADEGLHLNPKVTPGSYLLVNGKIVDIDRGMLRERRKLRDEGVIAVTAFLRLGEAGLSAGEAEVFVAVESRGWLDEPERSDCEEQVEEVVLDLVGRFLANLSEGAGSRDRDAPGGANRALDEDDIEEIGYQIRRAAGKRVRESTGRRPVIIPSVRRI